MDIEEYDLDDFIFDVPAASSVSLRYYQKDCLKAIADGWMEFEAQLIELCTGAGKTVVFAQETERWADMGRPALVLAHTDELVNQAIDKISKFTKYVPGKEKAKENASVLDEIVVASVQTLCRERRLMEWENNHFGLVVVDEAHRTLAKSYLKVLDYFRSGGAKVLGVTATADRGDKRSLGEFYQRMAYEYNLLKAVRDGYLVRPVVKQMPIKIDLSGVKSIAGDIDIGQVSHRIEPFIASLAASIIEHAGTRKTVIFMPSIETSRLMSEHLRLLGASANYVSGACSDRDVKILGFEDGDYQFLANASLLIEGWDHDQVSCVVVLRPTKIRSLYVQCVGRGTRPISGLIDGVESKEERLRLIAESSKPNLLLLDFIWLTDRLKLISPVDLVAGDRKEVKERMEKKLVEGDLLELEEAAERDMLESLAKEARKHKHKKAKVIDPLSLAVKFNDADLADYEPTMKWEREDVSERQREILARNGIDVTKVICKGHASMILDRIFARQKNGLATVKQVNFLDSLGFQHTDTLSLVEAKQMITEYLTHKKDGTLR